MKRRLLDECRKMPTVDSRCSSNEDTIGGEAKANKEVKLTTINVKKEERVKTNLR